VIDRFHKSSGVSGINRKKWKTSGSQVSELSAKLKTRGSLIGEPGREWPVDGNRPPEHGELVCCD